MTIIPQILFVVIIIIFGYFFFRRVNSIKKNIALGRKSDRTDQPGKRLKNMILVAFGQKKMFKKVIPAVLHLFIYLGFLIINLEVLEFFIDGLFGTHRIFAPFLGGFYAFCLNFFEVMALAVVVSCIVFLVRRNILNLHRFKGVEMTSWPRLDANLILVIEILLMVAIFTMNATDQVLQTRESAYTATGKFYLSAQLAPIFKNSSTGTLILLERFAWWAHIIGILGFAVYITYSKHLHIFLAFPNTYYANMDVPGKMDNMKEITNEVKIMLGATVADQTTGDPPDLFGAKDVKDLTWYNIMNAYACTECGRCTAECPANITGKKLSPRKIMMDVRDRTEEIGRSNKHNQDSKSLLGDYISREEIFACTSCNACVEACPVNIDPLSIILQLRRYTAMEESSSPGEWNNMFSNIETNFAPWKFASTDRFNWSKE